MKTKKTQEELVLHLLTINKEWHPSWEMVKNNVIIEGTPYWLGTSGDRAARRMAERGDIERKHEGGTAYYRLKQEHKQETMFNFSNHALNI